MRSSGRRSAVALGLVATLVVVLAAPADPPAGRSSGDGTAAPRLLSLASFSSQDKTTVQTTTVTTTTKESHEASWEISGPVFLRATTPEPPGEVIIKNIFGWEHSKKKEAGRPWDRDGDDRDEYEYELEIEWGILENHELIFEMPWQIGDGRVDGNGDITLGWHWRLWDEHDWVPAFAMRNFLRVPSGVDSSGVDYEFRGLFTKSLVPGCTRLHFNPFAKSVNGNNEEDAEPFQYGAAIGIDHRLSDNLLFITDYIYSSEETEDANRGNHEAEFGLDWEFAEHQKLGVSFLVGLDGDDDGPEYGAKLSYMLSFGG